MYKVVCAVMHLTLELKWNNFLHVDNKNDGHDDGDECIEDNDWL